MISKVAISAAAVAAETLIFEENFDTLNMTRW